MDVLQRIALLDGQLIRTGRPTNSGGERRAARLRGTVALHHGYHIAAERWRAADRTDRQLARILAVRAAARGDIVFSHSSAAVLLGLPLYEANLDVVHITEPRGGAARRTGALLRHRSELDTDDIVEVGGLRCTSPERTLLDLARFVSVEDALACADGHLRGSFRVGRQVDTATVAEWRDRLERRLDDLVGARGVRGAREMLRLADPRKDSVLESVSHLRLVRLGFEVELQVPVRGPEHYDYYVDFRFVGLRLFGECDGASKYTDASLMNGLSPAQLVYREKRRQDWICGSTRNEMIRWGYSDVCSELGFARRLHAFRVPIPWPPRGLVLR